MSATRISPQGARPRRRHARLPGPLGAAGLGQRLAQLQDGLALGPAGRPMCAIGSCSCEFLADALAHRRRAACLAIVFGVAIGMVMGFSRTMREALYPLLVGFNAIPKATVVPIVALMFVGAHDFNTVLIAFMISFFPIAVSVSIGLSTLEPEYRDILRRARRLQTHDLLENRPAQDPAGVFWRIESRGNAGLYRHQPDGNRLAAWARPGRALRQRQDQFRLPADVRGADRPRSPRHPALLCGDRT